MGVEAVVDRVFEKNGKTKYDLNCKKGAAADKVRRKSKQAQPLEKEDKKTTAQAEDDHDTSSKRKEDAKKEEKKGGSNKRKDEEKSDEKKGGSNKQKDEPDVEQKKDNSSKRKERTRKNGDDDVADELEAKAQKLREKRDDRSVDEAKHQNVDE